MRSPFSPRRRPPTSPASACTSTACSPSAEALRNSPTDTDGGDMAIRLVVSITAVPGKGTELAQAYRARCADAMKEPGCEQFEVFQSVLDPDRLTLLERWSDQAALDAHAQLNSTRPPLRPELRAGSGEREDYQYNRTR